MKQVLIFLCCLLTVYCALYLEDAPVSDMENEEGYSCKSSNKYLGLMKGGETRRNFEPNFCARASCNNGMIEYATCGVVSMEGCKLVENSSKPYPDCCLDFKCD